MSERRALLDPDMYKISEEDSQDEEVLSSLGCLSLSSQNNNNVEGTPRILPPSAPGQTNNAGIKKPKRRTGTTLPSLPQSLSNGNKRKLLLEKSKLEERGGDDAVSATNTRVLYDRLDWPNSTSSETDSSDTESARSGSASSETETNGSHHSDSSSSSSSRNDSQGPRGGRRHYRGQAAQNKTAGNDDEEETLSSSCSSCDTPPNRRRSNSGTTASKSDVEEHNFPNGSPHHVSERDIQSSTNEDGNVTLVESYEHESSKGSEPSTLTPRSKTEMVGKTIGDNVQVNDAQSPSTSKSVWRPNDGAKDSTGTPADFLPKSKNGKFKRNRNDLKSPEEPFPQTSKEPKSGKGRISRFLTRARLDKSGNSKETKGSGTKTKSRKIKMFRFKDEDENGEVREVEMSLTSWDHRTNLGRRATLSESLLGIVPGRFSSSSMTIPNSSSSRPSSSSTSKSSDTRGAAKAELVDDRIMVAGFIPGGPAIKARNVKIGDWLRTVNGNSVNFGNIDSVLSPLQPQDWYPQSIQGSASDSSQRVYLGLQRVAESLINEESSTQKPQTETEDADEVVKVKGVHSTSCLRTKIPLDVLSRVALIYITPPDSSTATPNVEGMKQVVFCWPLKTYECKWRQVKALVRSQGMFSTLYQLVHDVTGSHPILSKVQVGTDVMEVTYWSDNGGESLLLFAITVESQGRRLRSTSATPVMEHLRSAISFRWGTLARAFSEVTEDEMDRFLSNTLAPLVDIKGLFVKEPMAVRISRQLKVVLDEKLYAFESCDFYDRKLRGRSGRKDAGTKDVFHCLGSCLFYKEKLVISHLKASTQVKLYSWMMGELNKWSGQKWLPMRRLILWQRTYLKEKIGTEEPTCSYTVLVGVDHLILGFVLEPVVPTNKKRGPDVKWIQKALKTVGRLTRPDIMSRINHDRKSVGLLPWNFKNGPTPPGYHPLPLPTSAKKKKGSLELKNSTPKEKEKKEKKVKGGGGSILKNPDLPAQSHFQLPGFSPKLKKSPGQAIKERGGLALLSEEYIASYSPMGLGPPEVFDELEESTTGTESDAGSLKLNDERVPVHHCNFWEGPAQPLSIMKGNILFHFVQMEFGSGVMLSSIGLQEEPYPELFEHFRTTADVTYQILQRAANARKSLGDQDNDKKWVSRTLAPICEHGTMFQCQVTDPKAGLLKSKTKFVSYWVVGRLYSDKRATFLCYQDTSVPQDHVECAFRLAHSINPS